MNCTICGAEVRMEVVRPTVPSDWEYRYQSVILRYWVPGTDTIHHCRLKPRIRMVAAEPEQETVERKERAVIEKPEETAGWVSL